MTEEEWRACVQVARLNEYAQTIGSLRRRRLLNCALARLFLPLIESGEDAQYRLGVAAALDRAEQFADGLIDAPAMAEWGAPVEESLNACMFNEKLRGSLLYKACWACALACEIGDEVSQSVWTFLELKHYGRRAPVKLRRRVVPTYRDIFGNPFHPFTLSPEWRADTVLSLAQGMYESRDFSAMPILADALQDAGCDNDEVLNHCRGPGPHVRGCWVVDSVLEKE